jgi:hypothetical protein
MPTDLVQHNHVRELDLGEQQLSNASLIALIHPLAPVAQVLSTGTAKRESMHVSAF